MTFQTLIQTLWVIEQSIRAVATVEIDTSPFDVRGVKNLEMGGKCEQVH